MHKRTRQHGFTIVELIVTMSILGLMLFLINRLFNDTSLAVTTSVQTSKTIAANRSINEQITIDADAMIGPGQFTDDPGYIVIIQQRLNNVRMFDPQNLSEITVPQLRSDQIVFIRDAEGMRSMTPQNANSYRSNLVGLASDRAKVWYGHTQRTLPNGQSRGTAANLQLGGANAKLDRIGSNFILGRQAMLFNPTDMSLATPAAISNNAGAYTRAVSGYYNAAVAGSGFSGTPTAFMGLSDVTTQGYGPASQPNTLLNQINNAADENARNTLYLDTAYRVAANRLHVNTAPDPDATNYAAWAIAQGHAIFAQGCSEIIIDFAADLNGNGRIDRAFGGNLDTTGAIWWYDGLRQPNLGNNATGQWTAQATVPQPYIDLNATTKAFVFRANDFTAYNTSAGGTQAHSYWPYLIRIRYRLHDTRGRLMSNYAEPGVLTDGIDNDGVNGVDDVDEDKISGRWFERIIRVPRP